MIILTNTWSVWLPNARKRQQCVSFIWRLVTRILPLSNTPIGETLDFPGSLKLKRLMMSTSKNNQESLVKQRWNIIWYTNVSFINCYVTRVNHCVFRNFAHIIKMSFTMENICLTNSFGNELHWRKANDWFLMHFLVT